MDRGLTNRALKVMQCANQEAQRYHHSHIDTGHLLLGLLKEGQGLAAKILTDFDVDLENTRDEVKQCYRSDPERFSMGKLPISASAKKSLIAAESESRALGCGECGTEHLLLGLLEDDESVAARVLRNLGLEPSEIRDEVFLALTNRGDLDELI